MASSTTIDSGLLPSALVENLLQQAGIAGAGLQIEATRKGGNNQTFLVSTNSDSFFLKRYFPSPEWNRLTTEWHFIQYAIQQQAPVPIPLAWDPLSRLALYSFIEGSRIDAASPSLIDQAIRFFQQLNPPERHVVGCSLHPAAEACFSIQEHLTLISCRIQRLETMPRDREEAIAARRLLQRIRAFWEELHPLCLASSREFCDPNVCLGQEERCLSPSDFGFHNALMTPHNRLVFLDFEYAGWDDPAKMAGDFFSQLAVPVPRHYFSSFVEHALASFPNTTRQRAYLLQQPYAIKWCCIALNPFLPDQLAKRQFAMPPTQLSSLLGDQLKKAENLFDKLLSLDI